MRKLKCVITVTAGNAAHQLDPELTKNWEWFANQEENGTGMNADELLQFHENIDEALLYMKNLCNPGFAKYTNVNMTWAWL